MTDAELLVEVGILALLALDVALTYKFMLDIRRMLFILSTVTGSGFTVLDEEDVEVGDG